MLKPLKYSKALVLTLTFFAACKSKDDVIPVTPEKPAIVTTLAGSGEFRFENGLGTAASFEFPNAIETDAAGNIYVGDGSNYYIRKITPDGNVAVVPGGLLEPMPESGEIFGTNGLTIDSDGNIYVLYKSNRFITKLTPAGIKSMFAGNTSSGYIDATGTDARFGSINALGRDDEGNIYAYDGMNIQVRKITAAGVVSTVPGIGLRYFPGGSGTEILGAQGIECDDKGNIYTSDPRLDRICKTTPEGKVTILGNFDNSRDMARDKAGNIYVIDRFSIKKLAVDGTVSLVAGSTNTEGYKDGNGPDALFYAPAGIAIDPTGKILYVADSANNRIRKIVLP